MITETTESNTAAFVIRAARDADGDAIKALLATNDLPVEGIEKLLYGFVVAESNAEIVGVVGLETCGDYGLLRSTAVSPAWRGKGLGRKLVERIVADAESQGIRALYLLTTTAEQYFPSFGFQTTTRDTVPREVRATTEFQGACPASATVMCLSVGGHAPASPQGATH